MTGAIRILIADDHAIVREGLRALIGTEEGMELVGEAVDGVEAVRQARALQPDVILLDLVMPRKDGIEAIRDIRRENPQARILVLTSFAADDKVFPALKAGAWGYLLKDALPQELLQAIRDIHGGESSVHPSVARKLIRQLHSDAAPAPPMASLTTRERQVLRLIAHGLSNQDIADQLSISERTVRSHVSNLLQKLNLENRTQAALYAVQEGLPGADPS